MVRFNPPKDMPKERPLASIKAKRALAAIIRCFAPLRKPVNFSISIIAPVMCMTPMAPLNSCWIVLHRPKHELKNTIFESRMDSAFFNQDILSILAANHVKFTASVPFERFTQLKDMIEKRKRWRKDRQTMVIF